MKFNDLQVPVGPHWYVGPWIGAHRPYSDDIRDFITDENDWNRYGAFLWVLTTLGLPISIMEGLKLHSLTKAYDLFDNMIGSQTYDFKFTKSPLSRLVGKIGVKAVPVLGTALFAYDAYMLGKLAVGEIRK